MDVIVRKFKILNQKLKSLNFSIEEIKRVKKAYEFAVKKHDNQLRKSGEPYIIHPLETAIFLADWKMDIETIITGILHDVLEDTNCTVNEMEQKFGKTICEMVKTVSKVSKISDENRNNKFIKYDNNEYLIRVLMSVSSDIRPMVVKIADRLHNMQTISYLKKEKQEKIANETFNIYANIAGRLGMYHQKTLLLDLSFPILETENYKKIKEKLDEIVIQNKEKLFTLKNEIIAILQKNNIDCIVLERIKGIYSTYKKYERGIALKDIHDIFAIRIIGDYNELKCYEILGLIHLNFPQVPNTFKDYISNPKLNLYQSLHTTINYKRTLFEIQIRNKDMDNNANLGIASHWRYKEENDQLKIISEDINLNDALISQKIRTIAKVNFFDVLLMNNGKWYVVNENFTALDLAFLFNPSKMPYIKNIQKENIEVPLYYNLRKNDILTINYSENKTIKKSWIDYTTKDECKKIIENEFNQESNIQTMKDFDSEMKSFLKHNLIEDWEINKRLSYLQFNDINDFYSFFIIDKKIEKVIAYNFFSRHKLWKKSFEILSNIINANTLEEMSIKNVPGFYFKKINFTSCCSKLPGIEIIGNLVKEVLYIHRYDCPSIKQNKKIIILQWNNEKLQDFPKLFQIKFQVSYQIETMRINKIIHLITSKGFEITDIKSTVELNNLTIINFTILANNYLQLKKLFDDLINKYDYLKIKII